MLTSAAALAGLVLPVFGFVAVGYAAARLAVVPAGTGDGLADYAFSLALPALLFRAVATFDFPDLSALAFWGTYFAGAAVAWIAASLVAERAFARDGRTAVVAGVAGAFSNTVMLGLPMAERAYGPEGVVLLVLLVSIHLPVMTTASLVLIARAEARGAGGRVAPGAIAARLVRTLAGTPIVIALLAAALFRQTGWPLEGVPRAVLDGLAASAIPVALVSLGMTLTRYRIAGEIPLAAAIAAVKLLVFPAIVFLLARHVAGLPPVAVGVLTLAAASPTGVNVYLIAGRFGTAVGLVSTVIALSTIAALASYVVWLAVLGV